MIGGIAGWLNDLGGLDSHNSIPFAFDGNRSDAF